MAAIGVKIATMQRFISFWRQCAKAAFWGNSAFANDWQWLVGYPVTAASLWVLGYFYVGLSGRIEMTLTTGSLGVLAAAFVAYIVTWGASFIARLLNTPVILFHEQKDRADKLEGLRQLATSVSRAPSFDLGFERIKTTAELIKQAHGFGSRPQEICRIWVENLDNHRIVNCRVVLENLSPNSPVKNGALLILDNRGFDDRPIAQFDLAVSEKRYFKFLRLSSSDGDDLRLEVKTDQDRTGWLSEILDKSELQFGARYFATIAVHGDSANSRRINIVIDAVNETNICCRSVPAGTETTGDCIVSSGKYLSLEEARKTGKLDRFAKEHPSKANRRRFNRLLEAMSKSPEEVEETSSQGRDENSNGTRTRRGT